ncbi:MAG: hypothetical protein R2762_21380 [Bryobacteraceae bacterium]
MLRTTLLACASASGALPFLLLLSGCGGGGPSQTDVAKRESEFEAMLTNATLEGKFTSTRSDKISQDKYTIAKASKMPGGIWLIQTRIQYGDHDVTVPVPVKVLWAGDTPMITLTDLSIPGMGTFTARVMMYRDHYAGLWWSGKGPGGEMFGRIRRGGDAATTQPQPNEGPSSEKQP